MAGMDLQLKKLKTTLTQNDKKQNYNSYGLKIFVKET